MEAITMLYDNTATIMSVGMKHLRDKLGVLDSEIFIATIKSEDFDYTAWHENAPWIDMPLDEIFKEAAEFSRNHPELVPKNAKIL
jgi:hypothetical protein